MLGFRYLNMKRSATALATIADFLLAIFKNYFSRIVVYKLVAPIEKSVTQTKKKKKKTSSSFKMKKRKNS